MKSQLAWARRTFGDADLGDLRRTRRVVKAAARLQLQPAGRITKVFSNPAEREAAFRLIANDAVDPAEIAAASHRATARQCVGQELVYVALDETCLSFSDRTGRRFGRTGRDGKHRGMHAMSALAVDVQGTTLGLIGQRYWVQPAERSPKWKHDRRPASRRQSSQWKRVLTSSLQVMQAHAPRCRPWFQLDRGGDIGQVLSFAYEKSLLLTVRAAHDRAVEGVEGTKLWALLKSSPVLARQRLKIPARGGRHAREAVLQVRAQRVRLRVARPGKKRRSQSVELYAVYVSEASKPDGIEWMLWTTHPVHTAHDALHVVHAYTMRWRVEDFHKAWKTGDCNIESSLIRGTLAMQRWAAMTAAVAARAEHLKLISRAEPNRSAEPAIERNELDAAIILSETSKHKVGDSLTLEQAVYLIACVGGYTGKSSGGPPGTITIARGLDRVCAAAIALRAVRSG